MTTSSGLDEVWAFLADFRTTEQCDPPTVTTVRESGDGGVGTRYRNTSRVLGQDTHIVYTVIEHEPPHTLCLRRESDTFTAEDTMSLSSNHGGSVVAYTTDFTFTVQRSWPRPCRTPGSRRSATMRPSR